jgi:trans-aconitate methyltransferase
MAPQRKITGYDHDLDKVETARHIALKNDGINFIHADISQTDLMHSDAFLLIDTLHYLPHGEQEKILRNCIEHLNKGGCIIIRDADSTMRKKHLGTRISEIFSTGIGFNKTWKGEKKLYFAPREKYLDIFSQYQLNVEVIDQTKMNSNIIYIIKNQGI